MNELVIIQNESLPPCRGASYTPNPNPNLVTTNEALQDANLQDASTGESFDFANCIEELSTMQADPQPLQATILDVMQDAALQALANKFCGHTGKPCGKEADEAIMQIIAIHGMERCKTVLQMQQCVYSPEWLLQDETGLMQLAKHDARGYFAFACGMIFASSFKEKQKVWPILQMQDEDILRTINEIARRILARANPSYLHIWKLRFCIGELSEFCNSALQLGQLQIELQNLLDKCVQEEHSISCGIKGMQAFAKQPMTRALTSLEKELMLEFNDMEFEQDDETELQGMAGKVGNKVFAQLAKTKRNEHKQLNLSVMKTQNKIDKDMAKFGTTKKIEIANGQAVKINLFGKKDGVE